MKYRVRLGSGDLALASLGSLLRTDALLQLDRRTLSEARERSRTRQPSSFRARPRVDIHRFRYSATRTSAPHQQTASRNPATWLARVSGEICECNHPPEVCGTTRFWNKAKSPGSILSRQLIPDGRASRIASASLALQRQQGLKGPSFRECAEVGLERWRLNHSLNRKAPLDRCFRRVRQSTGVPGVVRFSGRYSSLPLRSASCFPIRAD